MSGWLGLPARAFLVGADAMALEIAANAFALAFLGGWYFYYLRPDLLHFTSGEIFFPYVGVGLVGVTLLDRLKRAAHPAWVGAAMYASAVALALSGT